MKYAGATLMLVLLPVLATTLYAQTLYPALPSKTRIKFERQLTSATEHIPCEKAYDGEGLSPRVWTLPTDIKALLEDSCTALPIVNKEKTMAFLVFYAYEHPDETNVMLGWAKHLLEKYGHAFEKHSLPPALAYFPLVSSDMSPDYVSGNGGVGNWKFKYSTARLYGLMVDKYIDERRLPDKSTWAAAHMLENFYTSFETYPLAVAAWICGPARVHKALKNTSNNNKFREVFSLLPEPEIDSYHAFTALNILLHNTGKFDLSPVVVGTENPKDTVFIIDTLHFGQVADLTGIDKQSLEMLNPHYVKNIVPASAQTSLPLFLPHGTRKAFLTHLDTIYHYRDSFYFKKAIPKTKTLTPGSDYVPVQYTIKSGDNIGFLSEWF
ncbi:MAG: transglycosylase SLT domain-containing protein, partial [Bacteroidota bacterium]|nr:transglycosylase SLT domain-containing protein [Bacteroidota bacterium]